MPLLPIVTESDAMTVPEALGIVTVEGNVIPPEDGRMEESAVTASVPVPANEPVKPSGILSDAEPPPTESLTVIVPAVPGYVPSATVCPLRSIVKPVEKPLPQYIMPFMPAVASTVAPSLIMTSVAAVAAPDASNFVVYNLIP